MTELHPDNQAMVIALLQQDLAAKDAEIERWKALANTRERVSAEQGKQTNELLAELAQMREALYECANLAYARHGDTAAEAHEWLESIHQVACEATGETHQPFGVPPLTAGYREGE